MRVKQLHGTLLNATDAKLPFFVFYEPVKADLLTLAMSSIYLSVPNNIVSFSSTLTISADAVNKKTKLLIRYVK